MRNIILFCLLLFSLTSCHKNTDSIIDQVNDQSTEVTPRAQDEPCDVTYKVFHWDKEKDKIWCDGTCGDCVYVVVTANAIVQGLNNFGNDYNGSVVSNRSQVVKSYKDFLISNEFISDNQFHDILNNEVDLYVKYELSESSNMFLILEAKNSAEVIFAREISIEDF